MFFVNDTQDLRHHKIQLFLKDEPVIAVLLSAADFEWTVRRAIISLGTSPNVEIRDSVLRNCSGLNGYKEAWKEEVKPNHGVGLPDVIDSWQYFKEKAFPLRHKIIHGALGTVSQDYAKERVEAILIATQSIVQFSQERGCDLYSRLKVRRRTTKST